jgi:hypothetical protein
MAREERASAPWRPAVVQLQVETMIWRWWASWVGDVALLAGLAALPFLFFWRIISLNVADRATFARGDFLGQYYPLRLFVAEQIGRGRLPLWNPYLYGGQPALADIQSAALYPVNLLAAWLLKGAHFSVTALEVQVILHFSLAACFTYLLVRRLTGGRFAGCVSALAYTFGGYMTSFPVRQMTMLGVGVWLPLILLFLDLGLERLADRNRGHPWGWTAPLVAAGITFGFSILGGHPQTSLYVTYLAAAYVVFRLASVKVEGPRTTRWRRRARLALPLLLVPVIGVAIAAAQLLPTLEFIKYSTRSELTYAAVSWGLPIQELVSLIYPGYLGNSPQYLGILPMILIAAALTLPSRFRDRGFWVAAAVVSLLLSFGGNTFLFNFFYAFIPGFASVRDQERVIFLFAFSLAVLAGYGAQALAAAAVTGDRAGVDALRRGVIRFTAALGLLTVLFLYGWTKGQAAAGHGDIFIGTLRHHVFSLLLLGGAILWLGARQAASRTSGLWKLAAVGLIALNLFSVTWEFHLHDVPAEGYFPRTTVVSFLQQALQWSPQPARISSAGLLPGGSSAGVIYGLRDITGNSPLHLAAFDEFAARMGEWRFWQLLNVRYVLDKRDIDSAGLRRLLEDGETKAYEVTDPFPPAWVVHQVRVAGNADETFALLNADDVNLRETAVVNSTPVPAPVPAAADSAVRIEQWAADRQIVQVDLSAPGLLIFSEVFYPGWEATVDGRQADLVHVDGILRGVALPAGSHRVEARYAPRSLTWGLWISAIALAASVLAGIAGWWLSRRPAVWRASQPAV